MAFSLFSLVHQQVYSLQRWCLPPFSQYNVIGYNVRLIRQISHQTIILLLGVFTGTQCRYTGCIYIRAEHLMLDDHAQCTRAASLCILKKLRFEVSIWLKQEYVHTTKRYESFSFLNETYWLFFLFSHFLIGLQRNLNFS